MVFAAQGALNFHFLVHENHAAMAADIVEDFDLVLLVAQDHQRQAHEVDWFDVTFFRQVAREPQAGPALAEHFVAFAHQELVAGVSLVWQAVGFFDRLQHRFQRDVLCFFLSHEPTSVNQCQIARID